MRRLPIVLLIISLLSGCAPREEVDLVLFGGKIVTVDANFSVHEAIAIRDGRVVAVGGDDLRTRFNAAREIDLAGRMVMPGFNDSHIHIDGRPPWQLDLTSLTSIAELKEMIRTLSAELEPGHWISGYGWSEDELEEGRRPLRADLDDAAPDNPVVLTRAGGHSAVANSLALELAGIDESTADPEGGVIEREENGHLNGVIRERQRMVTRLVPRAAAEQLRPSFVANLKDLLSLGITSIIEAGVSLREYPEWESVYSEYGDELPRANVQIYWTDPEKLQAFGKITGDGDDRFRVGAIKVLVDGGFTGPAAYTNAPYKGEASYRGSLNLSEESLREIAMRGHAMGWQLGFHAIGDAAIDLTVDAFVDAIDAAPREDHRHYLNHFTVMPSSETMTRMADHGLSIAQQPNFTYTLEGRYAAHLDEERLQHNNPLRSPMDHGVFVALGSDVLPIGPMTGLYAAVTRKGMSGAVYGPDEALTMEEAIRGYTANGAFLTFEEDIKGTLEPGKLADLVVLSDDLLSIDPDSILNVQVEMTILGGRVVFEREAGQADAPTFERERLMEVARDIIDGARYGALVTLDANGEPRIRVMDPFPPEGEMTIWFATNPNTRKVAEIRAQPRVSVYYFDPASLGYVTISGLARLVEDPAEKARRWKEEWAAFYPDRAEGYLLIEVTADWLEVVSVSQGINGSDESWLPPRVDFTDSLQRTP
jgi:predicted amidohydrolase YtcJ/general stress protein 26